MALPKIPPIAQLSEMLSALNQIDVNAITQKLNDFVATAQRIEQRCIAIERKLDAVIDAAEIKVNDAGNNSSRNSATSVTVSGGNS